MFISIIFFALTFAFAIYATKKDLDSSKVFPYYGQLEGNKITTDKNGFIDLKKNYIFSGALLVAIAVAAIIGIVLKASIALVFAGALALGAGFIRFSVYQKNARGAKKNRVHQAQFLRQLKTAMDEGASDDQLASMFDSMLLSTTSTGRRFYVLFGWIYSDNPDLHQAITSIQSEIRVLANRPETNWFPK